MLGWSTRYSFVDVLEIVFLNGTKFDGFYCQSPLSPMSVYNVFIHFSSLLVLTKHKQQLDSVKTYKEYKDHNVKPHSYANLNS